MDSKTAVDRPLRIRQLHSWPGAHAVVLMTVAGERETPPVAPGAVFADGSRMYIELETTPNLLAPEHLYDLAKLPLFSVLVMDGRSGIRIVKGMGERFEANDAERALQEIQQLLGEPVAVMNKGIDETDTRRRYWFKA